jgi:hypothetical protein
MILALVKLVLKSPLDTLRETEALHGSLLDLSAVQYNEILTDLSL